MKILKLAIIALLFLSACGQSPEEKQKKKFDKFLWAFFETDLPIESVEGEIFNDSELTDVDSIYLDMFTDTTGGFTNYGGYRHFGIRYAYAGKISLPEKPFQILFIFKDPNIGIQGFPISYMLYTFSNTGTVIDSISFSYTLFSEQYKFYTEGKMNEKFEIEITDWEKEWDSDNGDEPMELKHCQLKVGAKLLIKALVSLPNANPFLARIGQ